ncbi:MAG: hypothetical protein KJ989_12965 [Gammaproteobacteria bacterium]|uniref:Uncharacterized protein n=1 Tax=viral metagenome TaxID=1070528 RepID=A0A6H2A1Z7_9ZZZZ|nr:hypothetical protein [Gammaproteobacteria bacterium]MBU2157126.1 hypothetical protein [Gammaproteobacteria bacterium]MBU2256040.1 hypothetical protein [Gammaproteobacteria bacterium]MBU2295108.1 hypothetical protein [Gammaproteobacteria bacterium]
MSDLAARGVATIGAGETARDVVVYELTPAQMRQVLMNLNWPGEDADKEALARYQIDQALFEECSITDLALFSRLPVTELEELPPSQLKKLLEKAKELNPDFFSALARLEKRQSER